MSREKDLAIAILTEKIQKLTNKKITLEEASIDSRGNIKGIKGVPKLPLKIDAQPHANGVTLYFDQDILRSAKKIEKIELAIQEVAEILGIDIGAWDYWSNNDNEHAPGTFWINLGTDNNLWVNNIPKPISVKFAELVQDKYNNVQESLHESHDDCHCGGSCCTDKESLKEDAKDDQRISDIQSKSGGSGWKAAELARQMADKITTPDKAYNRYIAAVTVFGKDSRVANIFLDRAKKLNHATGTTVANDRDEAQHKQWEQARQEALLRAKVKADKFIKIFSKRYPDYPLSVTTSSPVQYQSGDGKTLYVRIGGDISRLTKGLSGLGDRRVVSRMHGAIRRIADLTGGYYDFNYSKPFVAFNGSKAANESIIKETYVDSPKQVWKVIGKKVGSGTISFDILTYKDSLMKMKPELQKEFPEGFEISFEWVSSPKIYKDSNLFKNESTLKEGTWALGSLADLLAIKRELKLFKDKVYSISGDDEFFDGLDAAATRLDILIAYRKKYKR